MIKMKKVRKGVHECFDEDLEHSFALSEDGKTIGYIRFSKSPNENGAWIEYILAKKRGVGQGEKIIKFLFDTFSFDYVDGTAIYEPHFFWKRIGARFDDEVDEDACDGTYFILYREDFYKAVLK